MSFAVYDIPEIVEDLSEVVARGVRPRVVAETPDESEGRVAFGVLTALGDTLVRREQVYCAVADGRTTYVTSANLTGYAMRLNMEMGVLIRAEEFARQVKAHVKGLILKNVLRPLK